MTQDPLIGTQLANFRVLRLLKRGGMARVYYGRDVKLERPVAIKVIDFEYRDDPDYAERFVREARTIASWRHENIVQIYYADDQDGLYYFCMEYIDGVDLGELLDQYRQAGQLVPHGEVLRIGRAIAGALDYAHEQGLIHRDVKPSNVMIAGDKRVVLADFGLALDVHRGTMGHVFGSTHYIAPEQAKSSAAAVPQSDLYSLGVILYQMLTGMVPFDDPSPTTVALQHCTDSPPPPQEVNPDLSDEIEAVLIKALSKKPEDRYPTGAALIDAMTQVLDVSDTAPPLEVDSSSRLEPPVRLDTSLLGLQLDEYRLESLLGQGGMARVYCGVDVNLDRRVAIKVIDTPFRSDPDYVTRFRREAQAIAKLEHPHIVRLYRYGQAEDLLYMAMQFVDGADLGSVLSGYQQDKAYMDPKNASHIIREICEALDYAHQQGVIHRDVKPSNVMLDKQGHAILTDFGLALLTEFGTRGQIFGSPHYVAPEQAISSANVVPQSDLYAIGVILYEIFTGQLPFDAPDPIDIAMLHMSEPPTPPSQLRPEIGVELEAVILKLLEKTPDARYQSGAEVADALDQALGLGESRSIAVPLDAMPVQPVVSQRDTQPLPAIAQDRAAKAADAEDAQMPGRSSDRQSDSLALPPIPAAVVEPAAAGQTPPGPPAAGEGDSTTVETVADPPSSVLKKPRVRPSSRRVITTALIVLSACLLSTILTLTGYLILSGKGAILLEALQNPLPTPTGTAEPTATTAAMATPRPTRITKSVSAAAVATHTPAATATATPTRPPTETVTAAPTHTPAQAATHTPGPTATPTRTPVSYQLLLVAEKEDSLFVVNAGDTDFPLAGLLLSNNEGEVSGTAWAYAPLGPGECVALWKDNDDAKTPKGLACDQVGPRLEREGKERFWKKKFDVYYEDEQVGSCDKTPKECTVTFEGMP